MRSLLLRPMDKDCASSLALYMPFHLSPFTLHEPHNDQGIYSKLPEGTIFGNPALHCKSWPSAGTAVDTPFLGHLLTNGSSMGNLNHNGLFDSTFAQRVTDIANCLSISQWVPLRSWICDHSIHRFCTLPLVMIIAVFESTLVPTMEYSTLSRCHRRLPADRHPRARLAGWMADTCRAGVSCCPSVRPVVDRRPGHPILRALALAHRCCCAGGRACVRSTLEHQSDRSSSRSIDSTPTLQQTWFRLDYPTRLDPTPHHVFQQEERGVGSRVLLPGQGFRRTGSSRLQ